MWGGDHPPHSFQEQLNVAPTDKIRFKSILKLHPLISLSAIDIQIAGVAGFTAFFDSFILVSLKSDEILHIVNPT